MKRMGRLTACRLFLWLRPVGLALARRRSRRQPDYT